MKLTARRRWLARAGGALAAVLIIVLAVLTRSGSEPSLALPLRPAGEIPLPGESARFDYVSLDTDRGLLFVARMGANELVEVDIR